MNFKTKFCLFMLLIYFNVFLRYFKIFESNGEEGTDSWDYHAMISQIIYNGECNWLVSPVSYVGFYPPAQEVGGLFFVSSLSIVLGFNPAYGILVSSNVIGFLSIFLVFLLSREINNNFLFCFIVAFLFSTSNYIVSATSWGLSIRSFLNVFIVFILLLFSLIIRTKKYRKGSFLLILTIIVMTTIHRSWLLMFLPVIVLSILFLPFLNKNTKRFPLLFDYSQKTRFVSAFIIFLMSLMFLTHSGFLIDLSYTPSQALLSLSFFESMYYLALNYATLIGLPSAFIPVGFFYLAYINRIFRPHEYILIIFTIVFSLFIYDPIYIMNILYIGVILLASFGLFSVYLFLTKVQIKAIYFTSLIIILLLMSSAPILIVIDNEDGYVEGYKSEERLDTGLYLGSSFSRDTFIFTSYAVQSDAIRAYTDISTWSDKEIESYETKVMGYIDIEYFLNTTSKKTFYESVGQDSINYLYYDVDDYFVDYYYTSENRVLIVNTNFNGTIYESPQLKQKGDNIYESKFVSSSFENRYNIFENTNNKIIFI